MSLISFRRTPAVTLGFSSKRTKVPLSSSFMPSFDPVLHAYIVAGVRMFLIWGRGHG